MFYYKMFTGVPMGVRVLGVHVVGEFYARDAWVICRAVNFANKLENPQHYCRIYGNPAIEMWNFRMPIDFKRLLDLSNLLKKKSFFLFGPRSTGKSYLIQKRLSKDVPILNLLESELYFNLSARPQELEPMIKAFPKNDLIVIDEIQRIPMLLNEVHRLIEVEKKRFLLTGSSGRKLKRDGVNLLAGRAWEANLFPLTSHEIPNFNLTRYLTYGGLPVIYSSNEPREELLAYANTYLKEEIQSEALVRKIPAFTRFLQISALTSGNILNFTSIASDAGIPVSTVREYYQILEDTFIGFLVPAWTKSIKRKALSTAKFYYFDLGVKNILAGISSLPVKSDLFGQAFEHFIALELRAYISYRRLHHPLFYWRSVHGAEVDFIIDDEIGIEVKSTEKVSEKHFKGLKMLAEENICKKYYLISFDKINRVYGNLHAIYWKDFLANLWEDKIIK